MTPIGTLIDHENYHLRMVAVHRAWATMYQRAGFPNKASVQFNAAQERLDEARERRVLERNIKGDL